MQGRTLHARSQANGKRSVCGWSAGWGRGRNRPAMLALAPCPCIGRLPSAAAGRGGRQGPGDGGRHRAVFRRRHRRKAAWPTARSSRSRTRRWRFSEENLKALGQRVMFYAQHGQIGPLAIVAASDESYRPGPDLRRCGDGAPAAADLPRAACRAAVAGRPAAARWLILVDDLDRRRRPGAFE